MRRGAAGESGIRGFSRFGRLNEAETAEAPGVFWNAAVALL